MPRGGLTGRRVAATARLIVAIIVVTADLAIPMRECIHARPSMECHLQDPIVIVYNRLIRLRQRFFPFLGCHLNQHFLLSAGDIAMFRLAHIVESK